MGNTVDKLFKPFSASIYPYPHFHAGFYDDYAPDVKSQGGTTYNEVEGKRILVEGFGCVTCGHVSCDKVCLSTDRDVIKEDNTSSTLQRSYPHYSTTTRDGKTSWIPLNQVWKYCGEECIPPHLHHTKQ